MLTVLSKISSFQRAQGVLVNVLGRLPNWRTLYSTRPLEGRSTVCSVLIAAASGAVSWYAGESINLLATVVALLLWAMSRSRWQAAMVMMAYLTAAGHPVPHAVAVFADWPVINAQLLFLCYTALYGGLWSAAWSPDRTRVILGLGTTLLMLSVPPLGTLYFGSPIMAAGVLFPGSGWLGLIAFWIVLSLTILALRTDAASLRAPAGALLLLLVVSVAWLNATTPAAANSRMTGPLRITPVPTHFGQYPAETAGRYQRQFELLAMIRSRIEATAVTGSSGGLSVLLLPEGVAGLREPRVDWMWDDLARDAAAAGVVVAVGNSQPLVEAQARPPAMLVNQMQLLGATSGVLRALVDVPVGSWKPWADTGHYPARWLAAADQLRLAGQNIGALMCWEELITWPWLRHAGAGTTTVLVASNTWFDDGSIDFAQRRATWAMARLFGLRAVRAANTVQQAKAEN